VQYDGILMDIQKEIETRLKTALGEMQVQLIVAQINLEASQARFKELEEKLRKLSGAD